MDGYILLAGKPLGVSTFELQISPKDPLPFELDDSIVFYIKSKDVALKDDLVHQHLHAINEGLAHKHIRIIHLHDVFTNLKKQYSKHFEALIKYELPEFPHKYLAQFYEQKEAIDEFDFISEYYYHLGINVTITAPTLMHVKFQHDKYYVTRVNFAEFNNPEDFPIFMEWYIGNITPSYEIKQFDDIPEGVIPIDESFADKNFKFTTQAEALVAGHNTNPFKELYPSFYSFYLQLLSLHFLSKYTEEPTFKVSVKKSNAYTLHPIPPTIVVHEDYSFTFPDFNDLNIDLPTETRCLYLLFLMHPEGLFFKNLKNYVEELKAIYEIVEGKPFSGQRFNDAIDPKSNRINEICAEINETFLNFMTKSAAQNFTILNDEEDNHKFVYVATRNRVVWKTDLADQVPHTIDAGLIKKFRAAVRSEVLNM